MFVLDKNNVNSNFILFLNVSNSFECLMLLCNPLPIAPDHGRVIDGKRKGAHISLRMILVIVVCRPILDSFLFEYAVRISKDVNQEGFDGRPWELHHRGGAAGEIS